MSPAEVEKLPEITEWAYRNSPVKDPLPCGEGCAALWAAEHRLNQHDPAAVEVVDALGSFETANGLWPSLDELSRGIGELDFGTGSFTIGWLVRGASAKWMDLVQVGAATEPELEWCDSLGSYSERLLEPGALYGAEPEAGLGSQPRTPAWTYVGRQDYCSYGGIGYYQEAPLETCEGSAPPPPGWSGWNNQVEKFEQCKETIFGRHPGTAVGIDTALRTRPFTFALPEDYDGQTATKIVEDAEPVPSPEVAVIEAALKKFLEEQATFNKWVLFSTTGEGSNPTLGSLASEELGGENPGEPWKTHPCAGDPVDCATGNESISEGDLAVGGRGVPLDLTRTYNSMAAASASSPGMFGYGWSSSFSDHLSIDETTGAVTVYQANGSTVAFTGRPGVPGALVGPLWAQATLVLNGDGTYTYTLPNQEQFYFAATGRLQSVNDRDGNTTSLSYDGGGLLEAITGAGGHKLTLTYNSEGLVEAAKDPMGHTVKYTYESGELVSVIEPGESTPRWRFKYNGSHELTEVIDGRGGTTVNEYNSAHQVISQTNPLGGMLKFEYDVESEPHVTTITNHVTGAVTRELFDAANELTQITRGYGTSVATTESFSYSGAGCMLSKTNGDGERTSYGYDAAGDRTSMTDPLGDETKWTYDAAHDVISTTTPDGETTTIEREAHGNPEVISRPAPGGAVQVTRYKYDSYGDLTSVEDPLKRVWSYEYDSVGDRTAEIDPEGDKRTWGYNEDLQQMSSVSPDGNVKGAEASKFTTTIERDAEGRAVAIIDPLGHTTKYAYDANGDLETETDAEGNITHYSYNADNERTAVKEPDGAVSETGYNDAGELTSQTDGNKHTTEYVHNVLGEVVETIDPLGRHTTNEYDAAGNLTSTTDAEKRTTSYVYDPDGRLLETSYSSGTFASVIYSYNGDGDRTEMVDGTGKTIYGYDQLDRLTEEKDGHGDTVSYEYDLANELTKVTYPSGKAVTRSYDKDGRLESVTDWLEHTTKFEYNADSDLTGMTFPTGTGDSDIYKYEDDDAMSEVKMAKASETLASISYGRNKDEEVTKATSRGLPGEEKPSFIYDENSRLTKGGGVKYGYDDANNVTTVEKEAYSYNAADELEGSTLKKVTTATYAYGEDGERTKLTPATGAATSYGYDEAGNLTSVTRAKDGETPAIEDAYSYNGEGLRASETISGTTSYLTWDEAEGLPTILSNGAYSFIYGPDEMPVEQINNSTGTVTYLHHDQQGSTRLITGSTGKTEATFTYSPYGELTGSTGTATTPLGYDGQYTSADTGLVYLRNRVYDPTTAQFLTVDPAVAVTREPYAYGGDNPVNRRDPDGLSAEGLEGVPCYFPFCGPPPPAVEGVQHGVETIEHGAESAWNFITENEGPNDEGEAALREKEAQRAKECGEPNPGSLEKLKQREIDRILDEAGTDAHTDKAETVGNAGREYDYYRDKETGEIYLVPKQGGEAIPTGYGR